MPLFLVTLHEADDETKTVTRTVDVPNIYPAGSTAVTELWEETGILYAVDDVKPVEP